MANTSTIDLVKPAGTDYALVSIINGNMDKIDAEAAKERGNFAGTYDATASYAVGDYCVYSGNLYKCTTAISGGEAWTAGHWAQVSVGEEIISLKDILNGFFRIPTTTLTGDLNSALTPGWYEVDASCTNKPPTLAAGKLEIIYSGTTNYIRQTYYCGYDPKIYTRVRYYTNNAWTWTSWLEVTNLELSATLTPTKTTLTLQNGWTDNGGNYILKSGNVVTLHIGCRYGTKTAGTVVTNVPSGARPSQKMYFSGVTSESSVVLSINTNGNVTIEDRVSANSYMYACVTYMVGN